MRIRRDFLHSFTAAEISQVSARKKINILFEVLSFQLALTFKNMSTFFFCAAIIIDFVLIVPFLTFAGIWSLEGATSEERKNCYFLIMFNHV